MFPYSYDNRKNIYDGFSSELWTKWWWPRKNGVLFLVHNKLQRFNYVVLTAQVRLMAQHTDMRCHFSHYQFVRTFLILPSIECHKSPTSMYKKNYLTMHYLEYLLAYLNVNVAKQTIVKYQSTTISILWSCIEIKIEIILPQISISFSRKCTVLSKHPSKINMIFYKTLRIYLRSIIILKLSYSP